MQKTRRGSPVMFGVKTHDDYSYILLVNPTVFTKANARELCAI